MGKLLSKIFGNKEMRILMLGLDAAGKTSEFLLLIFLESFPIKVLKFSKDEILIIYLFFFLNLQQFCIN